MLWEGNRQIQEYTDQLIFTTVYDQDSFEPVARIVQTRNPIESDNIQETFKVYHYHNNHLGTPQELTDDDGNIIWANYEYAWGGRYNHFYKEQSLNNCDILEYELQPIKFQGQFYDVETGLHYNRFRYYDSDVGMFIQRDPIELLGGVNVFAYAPNPIHWVDPLGLKELYYLTATKNGFYPVYEYGKKNPVGKTYLRKGEIWKIGETKNIKNGQQKRYSTSWLINNNLEYKTKMKGSKKNMQKFEKAKLKKYFKKFGRLPAGNKCFH